MKFPALSQNKKIKLKINIKNNPLDVLVYSNLQRFFVDDKTPAGQRTKIYLGFFWFFSPYPWVFIFAERSLLFREIIQKHVCVLREEYDSSNRVVKTLIFRAF
jgi:hypothetical protein